MKSCIIATISLLQKVLNKQMLQPRAKTLDLLNLFLPFYEILVGPIKCAIFYNRSDQVNLR